MPVTKARILEEHDNVPGGKPGPELVVSEAGLTSAEVQQHLQQYGYNELPEKKVNLLLKFLSYFWGPIPWMIEIAAVLSLLVWHWTDFWIIATLLVFNGLIGFWEEYQAGNAIPALKAQLALEAKVNRDGKWKTGAGSRNSFRATRYLHRQITIETSKLSQFLVQQHKWPPELTVCGGMSPASQNR